jgi:hypothetical protein
MFLLIVPCVRCFRDFYRRRSASTEKRGADLGHDRVGNCFVFLHLSSFDFCIPTAPGAARFSRPDDLYHSRNDAALLWIAGRNRALVAHPVQPQGGCNSIYRERSARGSWRVHRCSSAAFSAANRSQPSEFACPAHRCRCSHDPFFVQHPLPPVDAQACISFWPGDPWLGGKRPLRRVLSALHHWWRWIAQDAPWSYMLALALHAFWLVSGAISLLSPNFAVAQREILAQSGCAPHQTELTAH